MRQPRFVKALSLVSRLLMGVAVRLLGTQHANWAHAMQAELEAVGDRSEALLFAWGCFSAALGHALTPSRFGLEPAQGAGVLACSISVMLGCAFMHIEGAPGHYVGMNLLSLAFGLATFGLLPLQRLRQDGLLRAKLSFTLGALLLATSLGVAPVSDSAWLRLGPVHVNLPWLLLPALLVASAGHRHAKGRSWALGGLAMAGIALVLQADPVLTGLLATVIGVRAWRQHSHPLAALAATAGLASLPLGLAWHPPEAMPFVDQVLALGFDRGPFLGLALVLVQLLPLWPALRHHQARRHGLVWGLLMVCSLPGWLPSPWVGWGGSFIVGYLLSLAMLPAQDAPEPTRGPTPAAPLARPDPPAWPRSGLT